MIHSDRASLRGLASSAAIHLAKLLPDQCATERDVAQRKGANARRDNLARPKGRWFRARRLYYSGFPDTTGTRAKAVKWQTARKKQCRITLSATSSRLSRSSASQGNDAYKRIEAFLAKVQDISATGSFFWRPETAEITASEQVYHLFDLDPALPLTIELIGYSRPPGRRSLVSRKDWTSAKCGRRRRFRTPVAGPRWLRPVYARHGTRNQG